MCVLSHIGGAMLSVSTQLRWQGVNNLVAAAEMWCDRPWLLAEGGALLEQKHRYAFSACSQDPFAYSAFESIHHFIADEVPGLIGCGLAACEKEECEGSKEEEWSESSDSDEEARARRRRRRRRRERSSRPSGDKKGGKGGYTMTERQKGGKLATACAKIRARVDNDAGASAKRLRPTQPASPPPQRGTKRHKEKGTEGGNGHQGDQGGAKSSNERRADWDSADGGIAQPASDAPTWAATEFDGKAAIVVVVAFAVAAKVCFAEVCVNLACVHTACVI